MGMQYIGEVSYGVATATMNTALPTGTQIGDIVVNLWHVDQGNYVSGAAGWTALYGFSGQGSLWYKLIETADDLTQANNWVLGNAGAYEQYCNMMCFRGGDRILNAPPQKGVNYDSFDSTPEVPTITSVRDGAAHLIFAFINSGSSTITGWPSGYLVGGETNEGGDGFSYSRYKILGAAGVVSGLTLNHSSSFNTCDVYSVVIEPGGGGSRVQFIGV